MNLNLGTLTSLVYSHGWEILSHRAADMSQHMTNKPTLFDPVTYRGSFRWQNTSGYAMRVTLFNPGQSVSTEDMMDLLRLAGYSDVDYAKPSTPGSSFKPIIELNIHYP